jgi:membrane protein DedA with SNARE-associated domain
MSGDLAYYISNYGCLAVFLFIFLQEVGMPNPIPNEFLLLFSGYLASSGMLYFPLVLALCISADILAASILYISFYYFGAYILSKKPRWIPISSEAIAKQSQCVQQQGVSSIVIGRLSPFIRGYVAVISGILRVHPRKYGFIVLATSSVWASFYLTLGYFLAPYWNLVMSHIGMFKYIMIGLLIAVLIFLVLKSFRKNFTKKRNNI